MYVHIYMHSFYILICVKRGSNLIISGLLGVIVLGYFFTRLPRTALFWAAFVLTRPFGATMGDLLTKAPALGGMGLGTEGSTAVLSAMLVAMVVWVYWSAQIFLLGAEFTWVYARRCGSLRTREDVAPAQAAAPPRAHG